MIEEPVTIDGILAQFQKWVTTHEPVLPSTWVENAQKLIVLMGDETDRLYDLQQQVANIEMGMLSEDDKENVSAVRLKIKTTEAWKDMVKQQAKVKRIDEFIKIAKLQARLRQAELMGHHGV
jgi:hypothetical protein